MPTYDPLQAAVQVTRCPATNSLQILTAKCGASQLYSKANKVFPFVYEQGKLHGTLQASPLVLEKRLQPLSKWVSVNSNNFSFIC